MAILSKLINKLTQSLPKFSCLFGEIDRSSLKFIWKYKGLRKIKIILKRTKVKELGLDDLKTYYKVIKTVWYCIRIDVQISGIELIV